DELLHQRDAGAGGGGERARAVPGRANDDANRGQFVLALDDGVLCLAGFWIVPQLLAMAGEGVGKRRRRRDRVPRTDGGAAIHSAERGSAVAFDKNTVADLVGFLEAQAGRAFEILQCPVAAEMQRVDV